MRLALHDVRQDAVQAAQQPLDALPMSSITAGSRTQTIVPAMRIAEASPTPNSFTVGSPFRMKLAKTATMIAAAEAMTLPVPASPSTTARRGDFPATISSRTRLRKEHLVVHHA